MANTVFQNILKGVSLYYIDDAVQFLNPPDCEVALCGRKGSEDFCFSDIRSNLTNRSRLT